MYESATTVCQLIETISKRNLMEYITTDVLRIMTDKSCTYTHSLSYTKDVNHALATSAQRENPDYASMNALEQVRFRLQNHDTFYDIEPPSPVSTTQKIPTRVEFLYSYPKNYLQSYMTDVQLRNKAIPNKKGAGTGAVVKYHTYNVDHENDDDIYKGDGEGEDYEENVFYTAAKEFPKGYLEHDSELAIRENQACADNPLKQKYNETMSLQDVPTSYRQMGQNEILQELPECTKSKGQDGSSEDNRRLYQMFPT